MITPTGSPSFVVHMNVHSVWAPWSACSRASSEANVDTSSYESTNSSAWRLILCVGHHASSDCLGWY